MKVSIIISTYNRKEALARCLESVVGQTYYDLEIIVVDDASTDGTAVMMKERFGDSRVHYHVLETNSGGAAVPRSVGLELMSGDASLVWDSDDVLLPNAIERLVAVMQEQDAGVVSAVARFYQGTKLIPHPRVPRRWVTLADKLSGALPPHAVLLLVHNRCAKGLCFEGKSLDFIYYTKVSARCSWYHLDEELGEVATVSDALSLTMARKKKIARVSIERGYILDTHLSEFKEAYLAQTPRRFGALAYGAAIGLLLAGEYARARQRARQAVRYKPTLAHYGLLLATYLPGGRAFVRRSYE